jgi:hypothetical protein
MNRKRVLAGFAATGIVAGAVAVGGVALASAGPTQATASVSAAATPAAADFPAGWCDFGGGHMGGMMWGGQPVFTAAANYLGLSQAQLRDQLQAGKSLAALATARGKSVSGLESAIAAAATTQINASSRLTAAQKTALIAEMRSHLDAMVNATHSGGAGMRGADMPMRGTDAVPGGMGMGGSGMGMGGSGGMGMGGW